MEWRKIGLVIRPTGSTWMGTHAMIPVAEWRYADVYRIYFSGRDTDNRSLISYAEIDLDDPLALARYSGKSVLELGGLGCFGDNGVTPSWLRDHKGRKYL